MNSYTTRTSCRVCAGTNLVPLFSLGEQYVSNFIAPGCSPGFKCPIVLELCRTCSLVQAKHTAPQDFLYSRMYWYRSGVTSTMRHALLDVALAVEGLVDIQLDDIVLDIGANDGTLLRSYSVPCRRIAVEPARNLWQYYMDDEIFLINDFWSLLSFRRVVPDGKAKVITALGMFYDLEDPNQFIADVAATLHPEGIFVAQLMCLRNMLEINDVGNLAHEHLLFFSLRSLEVLFGRHGLEIMDIQRNSVNGQSYRLYVRHKGSPIQPYDGALTRLLYFQRLEEGLDEPLFYKAFFEQMEQNKLLVYSFIDNAVRKHGKKVWVYGASTKGNVLLQYYKLDNTLIDGAADRSPEKWGRVTVGTNIPIYSNETARQANPDYFLVLPYAFLPEFQELEKDWHNRGGRFIVPLPSFRIL